MTFAPLLTEFGAVKAPRLRRFSRWPSPEKAEETLVLFDRRLATLPGSSAWLRRWPLRESFAAGEDLKDLRKFPVRLEKILRRIEGVPNRRLRVLVVGGGSVGDFGGFVASVLKRGVPLIQVPSTWLSAIDSAHGGKNGLNVAGLKNQIGTIHPPEQIWLIEPLLKAQGESRAQDAAGELLKIALLEGGALWKKLPKNPERLGPAMWRLLPKAIAAKMKIVRRDPFERTGVRHLLNLGHTMGHVFEAEKRISHGRAIGYGLVFALVFSRRRGLLSEASYEKAIHQALWVLFAPDRSYLKILEMPSSRLLRAVRQDKKSSASGRVRFVFLKGVGRPRIEEVAFEEIVLEWRRQVKRLRGLHG